MGFKSSMMVLAVLSAQPVWAQPGQANLQVLAQAYDRCMATYAVRLTRTDATDDAIYGQATQSCLTLQGELTAAINAQLPPAQATEILRTMDTQAKPNFMTMLAKIRSDRAARAGG